MRSRAPFALLHAALILLACFATLSIPGGLAAQDIVETSSGIVATGELKSLRQGKVSFDVDDMQVVTIEIDDIVFLESPREFELQTLDGQRFFGSIGRGTDPSTVVVRGASYRLRDLAYLRPIEEGFWPKTGGYLDVGFNAAKANANVSLNTGAQFKFEGRKWSMEANASSYYNDRSDVEEAINRSNFRVAGGRLVGDRATAGGRVSWEQNSELNLDSRYQIGLGSGLPDRGDRLSQSDGERPVSCGFRDPDELRVLRGLLRGLDVQGQLRQQAAVHGGPDQRLDAGVFGGMELVGDDPTSPPHLPGYRPRFRISGMPPSVGTYTTVPSGIRVSCSM
jgi:hypothetical protein